MEVSKEEFVANIWTGRYTASEDTDGNLHFFRMEDSEWAGEYHQ